jgi:hypothetical protein
MPHVASPSPKPSLAVSRSKDSLQADSDVTKEEEGEQIQGEKEVKSSKEDVTLSKQELPSSVATDSYIDAFNKITFWVPKKRGGGVEEARET